MDSQLCPLREQTRIHKLYASLVRIGNNLLHSESGMGKYSAVGMIMRETDPHGREIDVIKSPSFCLLVALSYIKVR